MQGSARVAVRKVGRECYAATLSAQVRQFSLVHSEIRQGIERIFKIVAILFLPAFLIIANGQIRAFGLLNTQMQHLRRRLRVLLLLLSP